MSSKSRSAAPKLSACLIVRDEAKSLPACLKSLEGIVDEIVVVDTGSQDDSLAIAASSGAITDRFQWCDDFSAARNHSLSLAGCEWILWIDADEVLTAEGAQAILKAIADSEFSGYEVGIRNFLSDDNDAEVYVHTATRLFRNLPQVRFTGRIHEQIRPGLVSIGESIGSLDCAIEHHGYKPSFVAAKSKGKRTIKLLQRELKSAPDDSFQWFNLANVLTTEAQYAEALEACNASVKHLGATDRHGVAVHQLLIDLLLQMGDVDAALEAIQQADFKGYATLITEFCLATAYFRLGQYEEALSAIDRCIVMTWPACGQGDYSVFTYKRYLLKAQILTVLQRIDDAQAMLSIALRANPNSAPVRFAQASLWERSGNLQAASELFLELAQDPIVAALCLQGAARCAWASDNRLQAVSLYEQAWRQDTSNAEAWVTWVQAAESAGDATNVLLAYEEFVKDVEPNASFLVNWGRALQQSGDLDRALSCFAEALKRDPNDANAYFNCGDLLYQMGQYADAAHLYESGLRHTPLNADGWFVLGNAFAQLGLMDGARLAYRQCLAINPKHAPAKSNLETVSEDISVAS